MPLFSSLCCCERIVDRANHTYAHPAPHTTPCLSGLQSVVSHSRSWLVCQRRHRISSPVVVKLHRSSWDCTFTHSRAHSARIGRFSSLRHSLRAEIHFGTLWLSLLLQVRSGILVGYATCRKAGSATYARYELSLAPLTNTPYIRDCQLTTN